MPVSHFLFWRGTDRYEVFVAKKWDEQKLQAIKPQYRPAKILFLEEDDFTFGGDVFALDFFLMKKSGKHLDGKNFIENLVIHHKDLRVCLEGEVRRLAAKTREAYFRKEQLPERAVLNTLWGMSDALIHVGLSEPISGEDEKQLTGDFRAAFFRRKRTGALLALLQRWEKFLQEK